MMRVIMPVGLWCRHWLLAACLGLLPLAGLAADGKQTESNWVVRPSDSALGYQVSWEQIPFDTRLTRYSGQLRSDGQGVPLGFRIRIDLLGLDSQNEERDEGMQMPEWFGAQQYRYALYEASFVEPLGNGRYRAVGKLTLKGVVKPLNVEFQWRVNRIEGKAWMKGEVAVARLDFGIGTGEWATDEYVGLTVLTHFRLDWRRHDDQED